jgi:hypothetical protein
VRHCGQLPTGKRNDQQPRQQRSEFSDKATMESINERGMSRQASRLLIMRRPGIRRFDAFQLVGLRLRIDVAGAAFAPGNALVDQHGVQLQT